MQALQPWSSTMQAVNCLSVLIALPQCSEFVMRYTVAACTGSAEHESVDCTLHYRQEESVSSLTHTLITLGLRLMRSVR